MVPQYPMFFLLDSLLNLGVDAGACRKLLWSSSQAPLFSRFSFSYFKGLRPSLLKSYFLGHENLIIFALKDSPMPTTTFTILASASFDKGSKVIPQILPENSSVEINFIQYVMVSPLTK